MEEVSAHSTSHLPPTSANKSLQSLHKFFIVNNSFAVTSGLPLPLAEITLTVTAKYLARTSPSNLLPSPSHKLNARGFIKTSHCSSFFTFVTQGSAVHYLAWTIKDMRKELFILFYLITHRTSSTKQPSDSTPWCKQVAKSNVHSPGAHTISLSHSPATSERAGKDGTEQLHRLIHSKREIPCKRSIASHFCPCNQGHFQSTRLLPFTLFCSLTLPAALTTQRKS